MTLFSFLVLAALSLPGLKVVPSAPVTHQLSWRVVCVTPAVRAYETLRQEYGEVVVWRGLAKETILVQVWSAPGSWTITFQTKDIPNTVCLFMSGDKNGLVRALRGEPI